MQLCCGSRVLDLTTPVVMGVLNVTPDSFSDGGRYATLSTAIDHAADLVGAGAAIIDVGGESTRPGADPVSEAEELGRVLPVVEALVARWPLPVSVDTRKPGVMRAVVAAGAGMINDVGALSAPGALATVAASGAAVCLMHMRGEPRGMQRQPAYADVGAEVFGYLRERAAACVAAGIPASRLVVDPGFGFGKTLAHNLELLRRLPELAAGGLPVLVGLSRKSMVGQLTDRGPEARLPGSVVLAAFAVQGGARIVRAHDVGPTVDAVRIAVTLAAGRGRA